MIKFGKGEELISQLFKLPNICFQQDCSKKHHTTLHDAFQKAPEEEHQANPSITVKRRLDKRRLSSRTQATWKQNQNLRWAVLRIKEAVSLSIKLI